MSLQAELTLMDGSEVLMLGKFSWLVISILTLRLKAALSREETDDSLFRMEARFCITEALKTVK